MIDAMGSNGRPPGGRRDQKRRNIMRKLVIIIAAALALGLGITGVYALAGGGSSSGAGPDPAVTSASPSPSASASVTSPTPPATPRTSTTAPPTPDPTALADGTYPTFVRAVDVEGATVEVDVLQVFVGAEAHQAAIEDGVSWNDVRFDPVYIRNENPLLRTLPVARDAHIKLLGMCEAPSRSIGLKELRNVTTPFTDSFYYDVTVVGGSVVGITQKIAVSAC
jgi:hypothetical protein